jgi:uncharacterized surface protein with fasciclin (FAS1) repeats
MEKKYSIVNGLRNLKSVFILPLLPVLLIILVVNLTGCKKTPGELSIFDKSGSTMMNYLRSNNEYTYMVKAIEKSNLAGMLGAYGTYTAFIPPNKAFINYFTASNTDSSRFFSDIAVLNRIVKYHLLNVKYPSSTFVTGTLPTSTIGGDYLAFDLSKGIRKTVVNSTVNIDSFDIKINNGVVHIIDKILTPPLLNLFEWLATQPQYSIIYDAFIKTGNDLALRKLSYQSSLPGDSTKIMKTLFLETNSILTKSKIWPKLFRTHIIRQRNIPIQMMG